MEIEAIIDVEAAMVVIKIEHKEEVILEIEAIGEVEATIVIIRIEQKEEVIVKIQAIGEVEMTMMIIRKQQKEEVILEIQIFWEVSEAEKVTEITAELDQEVKMMILMHNLHRGFLFMTNIESRGSLIHLSSLCQQILS